MASSSSVKRLAELSGSSHLKAEGVWAYRRPRARDGRARNLEVCRASDVFIVGEMNFWEREKIRGRHTDAHKGQYSEKVCFQCELGSEKSTKSTPDPRLNRAAETASFSDPQRRFAINGHHAVPKMPRKSNIDDTVDSRILSTETSCRMESVATVKLICS
jgi:hypothetical protein